MKNDILSYKGFETKVEFDSEDMVLHGKILFIDDLVTFEADSVQEVEQSFHEAVEDYIETCRSMGKEPQKPFKGVFDVRIPPETHRMLALCAAQNGVTINQFVCQAIQDKMKRA